MFDYFLRNLKAVYLDLDIDFFFFFFLFPSIFGSFGFHYYLVLFLVGKKIREDGFFFFDGKLGKMLNLGNQDH